MKANLNMEERGDSGAQDLIRNIEKVKEADLTFRKEMEGWEYRY